MARFARIDSQIRANRFADSRESPDSRESVQSSRTEPLFCESHFWGLKIANRGFEAIRESLTPQRAQRSKQFEISIEIENFDRE